MLLMMWLLLRRMTRMGMHSRMVLGVLGMMLLLVRVGMVLGRWHMLRRLLLLLMSCHRRMLMVVLQLLLLLLMLLLLLKLLLLKLLLVLFGKSRIGQLFPGGGAGQDRFLIGRADVVHGALNFDNRTAKNDDAIFSVARILARKFPLGTRTLPEPVPGLTNTIPVLSFNPLPGTFSKLALFL